MGTSTKFRKLRVDQSPTRCPWCHETVQPHGERWVVCAFCLARHHDECWDESKRCSTCGQAARLEPVFGPGGVPPVETTAKRPDPKKALAEEPAPIPPTRVWPTLIVGRRDGCAHRSISEAIAAARPGTRILVQPGTYNESITIDKAVAIVADEGEVVVESSDGDVLTMLTQRALVQGLTIRARSGLVETAAAVSIACGELRLWDCDVMAETRGPAISVRNMGTRPSIKRCRVHDSRAGGIVFLSEAEGTVEACELAGNRAFGIGVKSAARPIVTGTTVRGGGPGALVCENGYGTFDECVFVDNDEASVRISHGGSPVLRKCELASGKGDGASIASGGEGLLEECKITKATRSGVLIEHGANPSLVRCGVSGSRGPGVTVSAQGQGTLDDCHVVENEQAGVVIMLCGKPTVVRCRVRRNRGPGIWARQGAEGSVEDCDLSKNGRGAVESENGHRVRLRGNVH